MKFQPKSSNSHNWVKYTASNELFSGLSPSALIEWNNISCLHHNTQTIIHIFCFKYQNIQNTRLKMVLILLYFLFVRVTFHPLVRQKKFEAELCWRQGFTIHEISHDLTNSQENQENIVSFSNPVAPVITPFPVGEKPSHMDQFISLSCVISDGDLPLHIHWTFNQQPITLIHDISIAKLGKRNSVLTIEAISGRHAGNYTCHAENRAGKASFSTELKVIGAPKRTLTSYCFPPILFFCCCEFFWFAFPWVDQETNR